MMKVMMLWVVLFHCLVLSVRSCNHLFDPTFPVDFSVMASDVRFSNQIRKLESELNSLISPTIKAVSAGISVNGRSAWSQGFGLVDYTNPSRGVPDGDSVYYIASQTKVFTALEAFLHRDTGLIKSMTDIVSHTCPEFRLKNNLFDATKRITFFDLVAHNSGLPRASPCDGILTGECSIRSAAFDYINKYVVPMWAPNVRPSYSNLGNTLLGRCFETVTHIPYEKSIENMILTPLRMNSSGFNPSATLFPRIPRTENPFTGEMFPHNVSLGFDNPAGGMYSSVNDMLKFINLYTSDAPHPWRTTLIESLTYATIFQDHSGAFSYPYEVLYVDGHPLHTKGGNIPGYNSISAWMPSMRIGMTILSASAGFNQTAIVDYIAPFVSLMKTIIAEQQNVASNFTRSDLIIGTYTGTTGGVPLEVQIRPQQSDRTFPVTLRLAGGELPGNWRLQYRPDIDLGGTYTFQMTQTNNMPCSVDLVMAFTGQWIVFDIDTMSIGFPTLINKDARFPKQR